MNENNEQSNSIPPELMMYKEKFHENTFKQYDHLDKLRHYLIILELIIPIIFILADNSIAQGPVAALFLLGVLLFWLSGFILVLLSLAQPKWQVDTKVLKKENFFRNTQDFGIEEFFIKYNQRKRRLIISSCILFFLGTISMIIVTV